MLKELIYTGIGATSLIKDRVEDELKKLEEKGKIDKGDIKGFIESLEKKEKSKMKSLKNKSKKV